MNLLEVLTTVRNHYLKDFRQALVDLAEEGDVQAEPEFLDEEGALAVEGPYSLPLRHDIALFADEGVRTFRVAGEICDDDLPFEDTLGKTHVSLEPFAWDECEVTVRGAASGVTELLCEWFKSAFRVDGSGDEEGLMGAVHFMADPDEFEDEISTVLDLGTAPPEAFEELLRSLAALGPVAIEVRAPEEPAESS